VLRGIGRRPKPCFVNGEPYNPDDDGVHQPGEFQEHYGPGPLASGAGAAPARPLWRRAFAAVASLFHR